MSYMYTDIDGLEGAESLEQAMCSVIAAPQCCHIPPSGKKTAGF